MAEVPVVHIEFPVMARPTGLIPVHEVYLEGDENLTVGSPLRLIDEGGHGYDGVVESIKQGRLGPTYNVRLKRPPLRSSHGKLAHLADEIGQWDIAAVRADLTRQADRSLDKQP